MKSQYAQAFIQTIESGTKVEAALKGLKAVLKKKHHEKLLAPILLEAVRILETSSGIEQAVVVTATEADHKKLAKEIQKTLKELDVPASVAVKTEVDETLIGGFTASYGSQEYDYSYKKLLKSLYESITK